MVPMNVMQSLKFCSLDLFLTFNPNHYFFPLQLFNQYLNQPNDKCKKNHKTSQKPTFCSNKFYQIRKGKEKKSFFEILNYKMKKKILNQLLTKKKL